jgi:Fic family protein
VRRADASYRGFAPFAAWTGVPFDELLWDDAGTTLDAERAQSSNVALEEAVRIALREAALTTGAIEDLYRADRGFTFSVAAQLGNWESDLAAQGPHVRRLFEAQLAALELVVDAATRRLPVTEAWIRCLHVELCREQET